MLRFRGVPYRRHPLSLASLPRLYLSREVSFFRHRSCLSLRLNRHLAVFPRSGGYHRVLCALMLSHLRALLESRVPERAIHARTTRVPRPIGRDLMKETLPPSTFYLVSGKDLGSSGCQLLDSFCRLWRWR